MNPAELARISVADLAGRLGDLAVLDTRALSVYAQGHIPGSINVPYTRRGFGEDVDYFVARDRPVALVADNDVVAAVTARELAPLGYTLAGVLNGGFHAWKSGGNEVATLKSVTPDGLFGRLEQGDELTVIDVREPWEYQAGHIPGARHIALSDLVEACAHLDPLERYVLVCQSGARSGQAQVFLHRKGFRHVENLLGGIALWASSGRPVAQ